MALTTDSTGWFSKLKVTVPSPAATGRGFARPTGFTNSPVPVVMSGAATGGTAGSACRVAPVLVRLLVFAIRRLAPPWRIH